MQQITFYELTRFAEQKGQMLMSVHRTIKGDEITSVTQYFGALFETILLYINKSNVEVDITQNKSKACSDMLLISEVSFPF